MARWQINTYRTKEYWFSYEEHAFWVKDNVTIFSSTGYHSCCFEVDTLDNQVPNFVIAPLPTSKNITASNIYDCTNLRSVKLIDRGRSWYTDWHFPENMSAEECDVLEDGWDKGGVEYMTQAGWLESTVNHWLWWNIYVMDEFGQVVKLFNTFKENN
jgi:hypothetical protein